MKQWIVGIISCLVVINTHAGSDVIADIEIGDDYFSQPYIDVDEWRDEPARHRYVHGGFTGTDTRFSFYFPPIEQFEGRFFQYVTPVPVHENLSQGAVGEENRAHFAWVSGGYFIETNGAGKDSSPRPGADIDPAIGAYRANAAAATLSRHIAKSMYGNQRIYGYLSGGSGGAYRTVGGVENAPNVWDGAVPYVMGSPMAIPNIFTVRLYAFRKLGDKLDLIADAFDAGGSETVKQILSEDEYAAFEEVSRLGFPNTGWHQWRKLGMHAFPVLYPSVMMADPSYRADFWSKPGYEGYDNKKELARQRVQLETKVVQPLTADNAAKFGFSLTYLAGESQGTADDGWKQAQAGEVATIPVGLQLETLPDQDLRAISVRVLSGDAAGAEIQIKETLDSALIFGPGNAKAFTDIKPGDQVAIDNSDFLAVQTYHRHQVPGPEYTVWDHLRKPNGEPKYPQRRMLLGPSFTRSASGKVPSGQFTGKVILVQNGLDTEAFAWQGDWYRQRIKDQQGDDTQNFRLWFSERTNHADRTAQTDPTYTVSYLGMLQQALHDVAMWAEQGIEPSPTSSYSIVDGQLELATDPRSRHGIQAKITLHADGKAKTNISSGETVGLTAHISSVSGSGDLVEVLWDFGNGSFAQATAVTDLHQNDDGSYIVNVNTPEFTEPGTYFATVKIATQIPRYQGTPFAKVYNLARARIEVESDE